MVDQLVCILSYGVLFFKGKNASKHRWAIVKGVRKRLEKLLDITLLSLSRRKWVVCNGQIARIIVWSVSLGVWSPYFLWSHHNWIIYECDLLICELLKRIVLIPEKWVDMWNWKFVHFNWFKRVYGYNWNCSCKVWSPGSKQRYFEYKLYMAIE